MNIHGKAEEQREDNIRRNKQVLATMGFALPEPKKPNYYLIYFGYFRRVSIPSCLRLYPCVATGVWGH